MRHCNTLLLKLTSVLTMALLCCGLYAQPQIRSQWEGSRVAFLGDSITDARQIEKTNNIFWNNLKDILGIEPYVYGISGHRMNQIIGQGEKLEAEHGQAVDAIIVFVGTNDFNGGIPLGEWYTYSMEKTIEDGPVEVERLHRELVYADSTFRGRANVTMRWLKTHYPDKQIILLSPLHRGFARFSDRNIQPPESFANACGSFIDEYVQAVKEIANVWAVPVIDLNSISGLYPMLDGQAAYYRNLETDRLHPNTPGQLRMAYAIAYQLLGYPSGFRKYVALSFDDGPNTVTTPKVLDVLEANGVAASFFVIGKNISKASAKVMQRAARMGCDIENHSFSHSHIPRLDEAAVKDEVTRTSALIEKYTGETPRFFRPPYIDHNEMMHNAIDLTFICGIGADDWKKDVDAERRAALILDNVKDGDIILLHDFEGNDATVEALKAVIPELKRRGFEFLTVPQMFEQVRGAVPATHNGKIYSNVY